MEAKKYSKIQIYLTGFGTYSGMCTSTNMSADVVNKFWEIKSQLETEKTKIVYKNVIDPVKYAKIDSETKILFDTMNKDTNVSDENTFTLILHYGEHPDESMPLIMPTAYNMYYDEKKTTTVYKITGGDAPKEINTQIDVRALEKQFDSKKLGTKKKKEKMYWWVNYLYFLTLNQYKKNQNVTSLFLWIPLIQNFTIDHHISLFKALVEYLEKTYLQ